MSKPLPLPLVRRASASQRHQASICSAPCKRLYEFEISRLVDRLSTERKGASRHLNQQIDFYHLSYIPFVDGFVTNDKALRSTALVLTERFRPLTSIYSVDEYHRSWIRDRLQAK